jgi:hypothetical protein
MPGRVRPTTIVLALALLACATVVRAQDIEPRAYSNIPLGVNFAALAYSHGEGSLAADPSLPLEDADLTTDGVIVGYARSIDVFGQSGKVDFGIPYVWLEGTAQFAGEPEHRRVDGFGDPRVRIAVNFLGAPALDLKQFAGYHQDTIVGASLQVSVPVGQYDETRLVNLGANRWWIKPEFGVSKAAGRWTFELAASATIFGDNDDYFGGVTRSQDPIYALQGGAIYGVGRGIWVALHGTYYRGGQTTVAGRTGDDLQENSAVRLTAAWPINRRDSLKVFVGTGVTTRTGTDFDIVSVAWQRRWGGGL